MDLVHSAGFLTHKLPSCSPVLAIELLHASLTAGRVPGKAWHCAHSRHNSVSPRNNVHAGQALHSTTGDWDHGRAAEQGLANTVCLLGSS